MGVKWPRIGIELGRIENIRGRVHLSCEKRFYVNWGRIGPKWARMGLNWPQMGKNWKHIGLTCEKTILYELGQNGGEMG